ncbi:hypothetical protein KGF54_001856 [Candida jiufengensis]|uniref:uncharacterized protein n=1 Tax=Candida jiufengensis TaxID=497108 RepID=UPI00222437BD|nr:uncharacterized protein KGF54_001856 [Candida jiufengensis]KAI5955295.1 hypothetical protein KGF54_001856 [Candida jiufengensis]
MSNQNATVLLTRLLSFRESSSFHLILDSLTQSSYYLIQEYIHQIKSNHKILYLSYETINKPTYATEFLDCTVTPLADVIKFVKAHNPTDSSSTSNTSKNVIIIDSLNYITNESLTSFIANLVTPQSVVVATYHTNCVAPFMKYTNYPSNIALLTYIASSIFEIEPLTNESIDEESLERDMSQLNFPVNANLNSETFKVVLTNRRKSGRSLIYKFKIDSKNHSYEIIKEQTPADNTEDEELLKDLTTFNLTTSDKQKLAREQVELPFMQAQEALGSSGGAIVYEFEKDDDYDEEDPYEDPF